MKMAIADRFTPSWFRLLGAIALLSASAAHADLTMVQEVENFQDEKSLRKEQLAVAVSGKRLRVDIGQMMTSLILRDKKVTYSISHETRQYVILPHDQMGDKAPGPEAASADKVWENPKIESTGKTDQISGFGCRQVLVREKNGAVTELWLSDDSMKIDRYLAEFQIFSEFGANPVLDELRKRPELHGFPIRVVQYEDNKMKYRSTVRRLDNNKIPDSEFEIPAGYAEMKRDAPASPPASPTPPKK